MIIITKTIVIMMLIVIIIILIVISITIMIKEKLIFDPVSIFIFPLLTFSLFRFH